MASIQHFDTASVQPEEGAPAPERVLEGSPRFKTWSFDEATGGLYAGIWEATPGKWRVSYDEWEYFHILSGHSILTSDSGEVVDLRPGVSLVVRPGFAGTWEVLETTRKDYVIRT